MMTASWY